MAFRRILVGLDFTLMDKTLIRYTAFLAQLLSPEKIYFLHVDRTPEIPEDIMKEFPQLGLPTDDFIREQLHLSVLESFEDHDAFDIQAEVVEWIPIKGIMKYVTEKRIDLLILGYKHELPGNGILASRLVEHAGCSVLLVPERAKARLDEIAVCSDFSMFSQNALRKAYELTADNNNAALHCVHAYRVPPVKGLDKRELDNAMRAHVTGRFNDFIEDLQTEEPPRPFFVPVDNKPLGYVLVKAAERLKADLIVVGARGISWTSTLTEGSTPQMLLRTESDIPYLVVRDTVASTDSAETKSLSRSNP